MAGEWMSASIQELTEKVAMGPFGSSIKVETFVPQGVPVVSGQHLRGTRLSDLDYNFISLEHADKLANANVKRFSHNVIITCALAENESAARKLRPYAHGRGFFMNVRPWYH